MMMKLAAPSARVFRDFLTAHGYRVSPSSSTIWDGDDAALDLPPSRVMDVDTPAWVAFCGGGYD